MDWIELSVATNSQGADAVSELLMRHGAKGTQIIDRADVPDPAKPSGYWELVDASLKDSMPEEVIVKAWLDQDSDILPLQEALKQLPAMAGMAMGSLRLSVASVQDKAWAEYWKRFYKPFRLGERPVIRPSWEAYEPKANDLVIHLDPGLAFGTGTHETTALCVALIEKHYKGGKVLDVGCGSGILAIAAAKLGAQDVLAIDIDPMAVRTAAENVAINGLEKQIQVRQGDLLQGLAGRYDLAVANILADVIIMLAPPLKNQLAPGATFICSGIIKEREQDVVSALSALDYQLFDRMAQGEWVALSWRAPA